MKYTKEEELFNKKFGDSIYYIFSPDKKSFVLTEYVSQHPFNVKAIYSSSDLSSVINLGKSYGVGNFIENEIFH